MQCSDGWSGIVIYMDSLVWRVNEITIPTESWLFQKIEVILNISRIAKRRNHILSQFRM